MKLFSRIINIEIEAKEDLRKKIRKTACEVFYHERTFVFPRADFEEIT